MRSYWSSQYTFDTLDDAQRDYDDATRESSVVRVELQDNGTEYPCFIVACFDAREPSHVAG